MAQHRGLDVVRVTRCRGTSGSVPVAVDVVEESLVVEVPDILWAKPAARQERLFGQVRHAPVAAGRHRAADDDLAELTGGTRPPCSSTTATSMKGDAARPTLASRR